MGSEPPPIVAIDGPAGSGKSTTAAAVAEQLGFLHLDSGALYRALTFALIRSGPPEEEWAELDPETLEAVDIRIEPAGSEFRILLDGEALGEALRTPEVTSKVSLAARVPAVRSKLLQLQRSASEFGGVVADGRDMGTVVFPEAPVKIFLTAGLNERARRRLRQEGKGETEAGVEEEAARIEDRDRRDTLREVAPLRQAPDATVIDTGELRFAEQVDEIVSAARAAIRSGLTGESATE